MLNQRITHFTLVPLTALALVAALVFLTAGPSTPALAADTTPDWQQMNGHMPMTGTMSMMDSMSMMDTMSVTGTMPAMMNQMMQQMQTMMGQQMAMMDSMSMTSTMPMHQLGMGAHMGMMGRMMQMTGMMMQMMGHMQGMMEAGMPMMHGAMPMTGTMPMSHSMGMGMMDMMDMMDMSAMHEQMGQMMKMMAAMHEQMGMMPGAMHGGTPVTNTASLSGTTDAGQADLTQTVQVGTVEIKVTPLNLPDTEAATLDFAIELNSHSQEIDIDLAKTASLTIADRSLNPTAWETVTPKGHHIRGVLQFSRTAEDGSAHLADATEISLVIGGLPGDAGRTFTWEVNSQ